MGNVLLCVWLDQGGSNINRSGRALQKMLFLDKYFFFHLAMRKLLIVCVWQKGYQHDNAVTEEFVCSVEQQQHTITPQQLLLK